MPAIYAQGSTSGDGYSVSYSLTGPLVLAPDGSGVAALRKAFQAAVRAAGQQGQRQAIAAYSPPVIKAGWRLETRTAGDLLIRVANSEPLAAWVENPTKPHDIYPVTKKALFWPGAAHPVRGVHHPGTPGKHRLPELLAALGRDFEGQIARRVTPLLQGESGPGDTA